MVKRKFAVSVLLSMLALVLSACGSTSPFTGTWMGWRGAVSGHAVHYVFNADGSGFTREMSGVGLIGGLRSAPVEEEVHPRFLFHFNWSVEDDILKIHFESSDTPLIYYFEFEDSDTLTIIRDTWPEGVSWTLRRMDEVAWAR